ncbi:hypothetical protein DM860_005322 [Cuscuta australis]|uniref:Dof zinc finger protein n=1 Tax=Cuscuta australis TaxID=267555 RepID=A0A328E0H4_9ASTE|nr:hypothetical protein DM860_005322 [Cuscuta australis]
MEEIVPKNPINNNNTAPGKPSSTTSANCGGGTIERKIRPQKDEPVNCPRCNSTNTKFCYYNNYSLSQPRYFCKTCRRYWTEGGSLRNIPVGGGSRKNRLIRSSSIDHHQVVVMNNNSKKMNLPQQQQFPSAATAAAAADLMLSSRLPLPLPLPLHPNPNKPTTTTSIQQDLNLSFSSHHHHHHHHHHHQDLKTIAELIQVPNYERNDSDKEGNDNNNNNNNPVAGQLSAMEMLSVGMPTSSPSSTRGGMMMMSSFLPMPIPDPNTSSVYSSSFSLPEYKPTLNFSFTLDGMNGNNDDHGGYNGHHHHHLLQGMQETSTSGRLFFPFEDLKSGTNAAGGDHSNGADEQDRDHHPAAGFCWNGVLGAGGASW